MLDASEGPRQFGVEKEMAPSGFFIHYSGMIANKRTFRFVGQGDDLLLVIVDGKIVLEASWVDGSWKSSPMPTIWHSPVDKTYPTFTGQSMRFGDWVQPGKHKLDILFGERPGGKISAILLVEEEGKTYPALPGGRPLLPIFTTQKLNKDEVERIKSETWPIATDGPVMFAGQKGVNLKKEKEVTGLEIK